MTREDLYHIGHLSKTTGAHGALVLVLDKVDSALFERQKALFVRLPPDYVPFMILEWVALSDKRYEITFEDIESPEQAEKLSGQDIFIPKIELPEEDYGHLQGVEGFTVVDEELGTLGTVTGVLDNPAHELLVMAYQGREVLIPVTETIITGIDPSKQFIYTHLPGGLLDLYLDDSE